MSKHPIPARAAPLKRRDKLSQLPKLPGAIKGDPAKLADMPTFDEAGWRKKWDKRLRKVSSPPQGRDKR